jgi:hypothetical protein
MNDLISVFAIGSVVAAVFGAGFMSGYISGKVNGLETALIITGDDDGQGKLASRAQDERYTVKPLNMAVRRGVCEGAHRTHMGRRGFTNGLWPDADDMFDRVELDEA